MDNGKYIIVECRGHEAAIMFSPLISHCDIGTKGDSKGKVISAGFFEVGAISTKKDPKDIGIAVWGKSVTLKLNSRKEDMAIIKKALRPKSPY